MSSSTEAPKHDNLTMEGCGHAGLHAPTSFERGEMAAQSGKKRELEGVKGKNE